MSKIEKELEVPAYDIGAVFGQFDENLILIEKTLRVSIILRNDKIKVGGTPKQVDTAITVLNQLFQVAKKNEEIDAQRVKYILDSLDKYQEEQLNELSQEAVILTHLGKPIKCKTVGQSEYIKRLKRIQLYLVLDRQEPVKLT